MSKQQDLNQLTKIWYDKIKSEGFEDIEQADGRLKSWSSRFYTSQFKESNGTRHQDKIVINEAKAEYYRLAEHFLYSHKFKTNTEKAIWTLNADGYSVREIAKTLRPYVTELLNKDNVNSIVRRLTEAMMAQVKRNNENG